MSAHDLIVIGASAGGIEALRTLVPMLPTDLPAAVCIVVHIPPQSPGMIPSILNDKGQLLAVHPEDGETLVAGKIYVAPPDHHLLVEPGKLRVIRGPKENRHRPAVDPLFRSAARSYGPRVIGVVLTGTLDDGSAGLLVLKERGGIAVVQDPDDALFQDMPRNAIAYADVDYVVPLRDLAGLLTELVGQPAEEEGAFPVSEEMNIEDRFAHAQLPDPKEMDKLGAPSVFTCPECHGTLWEIHEGALLRFRCRVGHAYTSQSLIADHAEALESALWVALRTLEESISLSRRMATRAREDGHVLSAERFDERAEETEQHADAIRLVLVSNKNAEDITEQAS
jgi:two-component system, chemotaxis family, protein-glutamate methylesterase/glutaminase